MTDILRTSRLRLRVLDSRDAAFYLELVNDPAFIAHIGDRGLRTLEAARKAIEEGPVAMQRSRGHSIWLVEPIEGGAPLGLSGLIKREVLDDVDLGYAFLPQHRGRGYAFEAAQAVAQHARTLGIARLAAIVDPANAASIALLLKLGMRFDRFAELTPGQPGVNVYLMDTRQPG
ncbi:GNAT family N-acetyltransferase [Massilia yuzhufengensis]|uniref:Protein N-acetyltransferase, RimJ/RimL family n=1 Tax=Massilia yuzhufengensis TaxID=1164594 RepID=A0A1I1IAA1_9BURK|nr:GNAT family N-acetyltransferase [Massilia yuzhufengensis]SFC33176.1 Protein N-acetyltransferase, RimJ/RimL family [Massilia yuzhufengensis]